jgi:hypothetical protein
MLEGERRVLERVGIRGEGREEVTAPEGIDDRRGERSGPAGGQEGAGLAQVVAVVVGQERNEPLAIVVHHGSVEGSDGLITSARFVLHRFVTNTQERTNAFFFQLELSGLSRLGTNPIEVLRQGISGYTPPSLRPARSEPYFPGMDTQ